MLDLNLTLGMDLAAVEAEQDYDVIVVGGGPAGSSAAIYAARAGLRTLVIDKALSSGALGITHKIANYPGVPGEVSGAELVRIMREQAESFGACYVQAQVVSADVQGEWKTVVTATGTFRGRVLIVATGALGRVASLRGEEALLGRGVSYCATCDAPFFRGRDVAVVGSNAEAVEEALHLAQFARTVYFLSPKREVQAPESLKVELMSHPGVEVRPGARVRAIEGDGTVHGLRLERDEFLPVAGAFVYLQGNRPITDFLNVDGLTTSSGCLVVDKDMQTPVPGVFAVGDVVCDHVKQAVVAAADGAIAGMAADKFVHGRTTLRTDWA